MNQQPPTAPQQAQQYQKNPNGGYLKPSSHGEGRETAVLEFTPELINELYRQSQQYGMGYVRANVSELKAGRFGNYRRATMKPLLDQQIANHSSAKSQATPAPAPVHQPVQAAPVQQAPVQTNAVSTQAVPQAQAPAPMPAAATPVQQPVAQAAAPVQADFVEDEIPF